MQSSFRRRASYGIAVAALGLTALSAHPAAAQSTNTALVADDIDPAAGFGGQSVTGFTFSFANLNSVAVSASPTVLFYDSSGSGGGPGALIGGLVFNPITQGAGSVGLYTFNPGTALFTLPASGGYFWAGISFNSATATTAQLNDLGQGIFSPPTVGSSQDAFFKSGAPATVSSDPSGGIYNFGGSPAGDFGWSFLSGSSTVYSDTTNFTGSAYVNGGAVSTAPEPSGVAAFAFIGLGAAGLVVRARRHRASGC